MSTQEFNYLLVNANSSMQRFAIGFTKNIEDAEDLMQDTMLKALRYRDHFEDGTNFSGWIYTIMRNTFLNKCKRNQATMKMFIRNAPNAVTDWRSISENNISTDIQEKDIWLQVNSLSEEVRNPFKMAFEGFQYEEIASALGIPTGTVKSRIFNARKRLMASC